MAEEEIPVLPQFKPHTIDAGTSTERIAMNDAGTDAMDVNIVEKATTDAQTDTTLPHTMRNIMWSAEGLDPIVDCADEDDCGTDGESITTSIMEGARVDDIDFIDESPLQSESPEDAEISIGISEIGDHFPVAKLPHNFEITIFWGGGERKQRLIIMMRSPSPHTTLSTITSTS